MLFHCIPFGPDGHTLLDIVRWVPLGLDMARRALSNKKASGLRKILRSSWQTRHVPLCHNRLLEGKRLPKPEGRLSFWSECYKAGWCSCNGNGKADLPLAKSVESVLRKMLQKVSKQPRTRERKEYDKRRLFLCCYPINTGDEVAQSNHIIMHVGAGNLTTGTFTFTWLRPVLPVYVAHQEKGAHTAPPATALAHRLASKCARPRRRVV